MPAKQHTFELAVRAYSDDLYRFAYWLCKHPSDAEGLVQECFQRAWRAWHTLQDEKAVKAWLFTILRREFLRRCEKIPMETDPLEDHPDIPDTQPGHDDVLALRQALHQAPLSLREPLLLQVLGGFSCDEIAELQQTSSGAVMTRLTRARHWLRRFLNATSDVTEAKS